MLKPKYNIKNANPDVKVKLIRSIYIKPRELFNVAGANGTINISLLHHKATGWTYNNGAFTPIIAANTICDMATDHGTDVEVDSDDHFAYKRTALDTVINGSDSEGIIIWFETSAQNTIEYANMHLGIEF